MGGIGIKENIEKAVFWFKKAAENGDPMAQHRLGKLYTCGTGVEKNIEKAAVSTGRKAEDIIMVAATKTVSADIINKAISLGVKNVP